VDETIAAGLGVVHSVKSRKVVLSARILFMVQDATHGGCVALFTDNPIKNKEFISFSVV